MPLIIPNQLPAAETLQSENIFTMERGRASTQEIRPLKICHRQSDADEDCNRDTACKGAFQYTAAGGNDAGDPWDLMNRLISPRSI